MKSLFITLTSTVVVTLTLAMFGESDNYTQERNRILQVEKSKFVGGQLNLTEKEKEVSDIILKVKQLELAEAYTNVTSYLPAQHFFNVREKIEKSEMFDIIKRFPKGGSLHTHYLSAVSVDFIIEDITYRDNIYGCDMNGTFKLCFLSNADRNTTCTWKKLEDYRKEYPNFNAWLRSQLSLEVDNPDEAYPTANSIWAKFKKTFNTQYDMVSYKPVFEAYIYRLLQELYMDNVIYTELRGTFMPLYELDGTKYSNKEFLEIFVKVVETFKSHHPNFIGARYIHSVYRGVNLDDLRRNVQELVHLKKLFPDFIAGFDFVGYEEEGHRLFDFHEVLLELSNSLNFYFHAGETNWFGHTDENLVDAVLLNTTRIGHGFGLNKHPIITKLARDKDICVELCPISNQVLMLIKDPRNHPMIDLMSEGFPVVICNDDPSAWGATGLSFDWYVAFMAMTSANNGIQVLKQFALNSFFYSAMKETEKHTVIQKWEKSWLQFLEEILSLYKDEL